MTLDKVLVNNGGLENVFVYVKDGLGNYYFDPPTAVVTLDQKGCRYSPHVFGLRTGQPFEIGNSDQTMHTVHAMAKNNQEFNLAQPLQGIKQTKSFTAPEVMVHFKCNVHNWMERLRRRPQPSVLRRDGKRRRVRAEGPPGGHLHDRGVAREARHADAERHARREGNEEHHLRVQGHSSVTWLHRYIKLVVASTVLLIAAGGMVTSTDSGLAVPDWPNTYGQFMFSFPLEKMVGGIFYEHGHRMIASTVGFLTILLAVWTWKADPRRWMRWLGVAALGAVILQGLLGGITVLLLLPAPVSIGHAGLAQLFFCLTISLALFTSPGWTKPQTAVDDPTLRRVALATTVMVYCQIILGATMRHIEAGMAIPDFPSRSGTSCRRSGMPVSRSTSRIAWARSSSRSRFWRRPDASGVITARAASSSRPATLLVLFVLTQVSLGAFVIWSGLQPIINTAHVVNGALVLATSLVLTLRSYRYRFGRRDRSAGSQCGPREHQRILTGKPSRQLGDAMRLRS